MTSSNNDTDLDINPFGILDTVYRDVLGAPGGGDINITTTSHEHDQTPIDPVEEAELKLQGICPACRNPVEDHLWSCKHNVFSGYTLDIGTQWNFSTHVEPTITLGTTSISEERMKKLNRIADALDDNMLDRLDEIITKLKEDT